MPPASLTPVLRETLAVFEGSATPRTTTEVAEHLDIGRRSTYERLERLVDSGALETKKVGANARVWWRPADETTGEPTTAASNGRKHNDESPQLDVLIDAVEEYAIFLLDPEERVQTWNTGARRIKGYEHDEIIGTHVSTFYTTDDRDARVPEQNMATARTHGSTEDEGWRVRKDGSRFWAHVTITAIRDADGELRGYAKVTRDMTDRREREETLRRERDLVERVFETSPVGLGVLSEEGLEQTNARAAQIYGSSTADIDEYVVGQPDVYDESGQPVPPEDRPNARVFETGDPIDGWECQLDAADGGRRWLSVSAAPVRSKDGEVERVVVATDDITHLKEQTRQLERQRESLADELDEMFHRVDDAFLALDREWRFTYLNDEATRLLQRTHEELLDTGIWEAFPEAVGSTFQREYERAMATQEAVAFDEFYPPLDTWFEVRAYPSETGLSVYFHDITERKEREFELERYETIFETIGDAIYVVDDQQRFVKVNRMAEELSGYDRDRILGARVADFIGQEAAARALELGEALAWGDEEVAAADFKLSTADGADVPIDVRFTRLPIAEGRIEYVGVARDISGRKQRERELERYETIVETVEDGIYSVDRDHRFELVNAAYCELVGRSREELLGEHISLVVDEDVVETARRRRADASTTGAEAGKLELDLGTPDGETHTTEVNYSYLRDDGDIEGVVGVIRDISERKERERTLELFETIVSTIDDGVYVLDDEFCFAMVNDAYVEMTGYDRDELLGAHRSLVVDDTVAEESTRQLGDLAAEDVDSATLEADILRADGSRLRAESNLTVLPSSDAECPWKVGVIRDVTQRVARERELEESRRRYQTLVEHFPNGAVALVDGSLQYMTVGGTPLEEAGVTKTDITGMSLREALPSAMADTLVPHYEAAFEGESAVFEHAFGEHVYQFHIIPVRDDDGTVFAALGMSQDITERRAREHKLEQQREQLAALNQLNTVVRGITHGVLEQSTREEIQTAVCERLAASDSYRFAWYAEVDPGTTSVTPRVEAGVDGYLDVLVGESGSTIQESDGPIASAVRTAEMQILTNVYEDPRFERWRDIARQYDYRALALIPVVHEDVLYGLIGVYTDREGAFTAEERSTIDKLGEIVGHAIGAVERKRALMSDEVTELRFRIQDVFGAFDLPVATDDPIIFARAVPVGDDVFLEYGRTTEEGLGVLEVMVDHIPHWEDVAIQSRAEGTVRFELRLNHPPVVSAVAAHGGTIQETVIEDGDIRMTVHLSPGVEARHIIDAVKSAYPVAELVARRQTIRPHTSVDEFKHDLDGDLTERQRTVLEAAYHSGYFEWPRDSTGADVAESLGVSPPTFSQHLRKAENKLLAALYAPPTESGG